MTEAIGFVILEVIAAVIVVGLLLMTIFLLVQGLVHWLCPPMVQKVCSHWWVVTTRGLFGDSAPTWFYLEYEDYRCIDGQIHYSHDEARIIYQEGVPKTEKDFLFWLMKNPVPKASRYRRQQIPPYLGGGGVGTL